MTSGSGVAVGSGVGSGVVEGGGVPSSSSHHHHHQGSGVGVGMLRTAPLRMGKAALADTGSGFGRIALITGVSSPKEQLTVTVTGMPMLLMPFGPSGNDGSGSVSGRVQLIPSACCSSWRSYSPCAVTSGLWELHASGFSAAKFAPTRAALWRSTQPRNTRPKSRPASDDEQHDRQDQRELHQRLAGARPPSSGRRHRAQSGAALVGGRLVCHRKAGIPRRGGCPRSLGGARCGRHLTLGLASGGADSPSAGAEYCRRPRGLADTEPGRPTSRTTAERRIAVLRCVA